MHLGTAQAVTHDRWDGHQESSSRISPGTQGLHLGVVAWDPGAITFELRGVFDATGGGACVAKEK